MLLLQLYVITLQSRYGTLNREAAYAPAICRTSQDNQESLRAGRLGQRIPQLWVRPGKCRLEPRVGREQPANAACGHGAVSWPGCERCRALPRFTWVAWVQQGMP